MSGTSPKASRSDLIKSGSETTQARSKFNGSNRNHPIKIRPEFKVDPVRNRPDMVPPLLGSETTPVIMEDGVPLPGNVVVEANTSARKSRRKVNSLLHSGNHGCLTS